MVKPVWNNALRNACGGLLAAGAAGFMVTGCSPQGNPPAASPSRALPSGPASAAAANAPGKPASPASDAGAGKLTRAELDAVTKANRPYVLALVVKTRNNPFFDPMIHAAEAEAKALGVTLDVQAPPQEMDKERQFGMVQDFAARKVDAILVTPADSRAIVPALKQAQDKGVLAVDLDNRIDSATAAGAGLKLGAYVGADNEEGGRLAGVEMGARLPAGGKVAILEGLRGADNGEARKRGFETGIQGKLSVVTADAADWDTLKAYTKTQPILASHPEIQGIFCANDKMALGALKAIAESGKKGKITVVGYDNIPDVHTYLQDGELDATIEQHPDLMGKYGVLAAVGILNGTVTGGREFLVPLEVMRKSAAP